MVGRQKARGLVAAATATALCCVAALAVNDPAGAQATDPRPNFVVVMADDLHPQMMRALPSVRRLVGRSGTTFDSAISSYPLCCPARASLLTGQYAHNHGAKGNNAKSGGGYGALIDPERNLAAWLQASGYDTAFAGKWLNGFRTPRRTPPGWTEWWGLVGAGGEGLSSFYDFDVFADGGRPTHFGTRASDYQTDVLTREYALPFIDSRSTDPDPFFLWLAYHPPHSGLGRDDAAGRRCSTGPPASRKGEQSAIPPPRYATRFEHARVPASRSYDERDVSDKPRFLREPRLDRADEKRIERDYRCGLAALLALDDAIEDLVNRLRARGELADTVLVFTADHGVMAGEHRQARGKNLPYEEVLRVPLVVRGPGVAAGGRVRAPVANIDLAPTILELAGAPIPPELARTVDGRSIVAQLTGGAATGERGALLIEGRKNVARSRRSFKVRSYVGTRTSRYAYIEHRRATYPTEPAGRAAPIGGGRVTDVELYDLRRDPLQLRSRHRDPAYGAVHRRLKGLTSRLQGCAGEGCSVAARVPRPRP